MAVKVYLRTRIRSTLFSAFAEEIGACPLTLRAFAETTQQLLIPDDTVEQCELQDYDMIEVRTEQKGC